MKNGRDGEIRTHVNSVPNRVPQPLGYIPHVYPVGQKADDHPSLRNKVGQHLLCDGLNIALAVNCPTAVRLKVEESQLVDVFGEIRVRVDGLKSA